MATFSIDGEEIVTKIVGDGGFSGRIYLPKSWLGDTVIVVRLSKQGPKKERTEGDGGEKGCGGTGGR